MLKVISHKLLWIGGLISLLFVFAIPMQSQTAICTLTFDSAVNLINGHGNAAGIGPGDTICLKKGQKSFLLISYLHGTKNNPIVIQNAEGLVLIKNSSNYGVKFDSCSNLKFSGAGMSTIQYGIKVDHTVGAGVSVDGLSTDIEIENIEIVNTGLAGIFAKTEPDCLFNSTRDKFTLRNLSIHDTYIHKTGMEGMYIGSSKYAGQHITCNGRDTLVYPHMLKGVKVYRNLVQEAGWDAIQVSSTDSGCFINDNTIIDDSQLAVYFQMSGILVGGGTNASVFNNLIKNGKGDGIDVISMGVQYIYNNLIINPGRSFKPDSNFSPWLKYGMYISSEYGSLSNSYLILFNTIISPKSYGVTFADTKSTKNIIADNIIVDPGSYPTEGEKAYINLGTSSTNVTLYNNLTTPDINFVEFIDPGQGKFDLKPNSPAVNKGSAVKEFNLFYDILNRIRPFAKYYDIGAYECHDSSLLHTPAYEDAADMHLTISPNPSSNHFNVSYRLFHPSDVTFSLNDNQGRIVQRKQWTGQKPGTHQFILNRETLKPGIYVLIFRTGETFISKKLIILNN